MKTTVKWIDKNAIKGNQTTLSDVENVKQIRITIGEKVYDIKQEDDGIVIYTILDSMTVLPQCANKIIVKSI